VIHLPELLALVNGGDADRASPRGAAATADDTSAPPAPAEEPVAPGVSPSPVARRSCLSVRRERAACK